MFSAEIWILNDGPNGLPAGEIEVALAAGGLSRSLLTWAFPALAPGRNLAGPSVQSVLPPAADGVFELVLEAKPRTEWSTRYRLSLLGAAG